MLKYYCDTPVTTTEYMIDNNKSFSNISPQEDGSVTSRPNPSYTFIQGTIYMAKEARKRQSDKRQSRREESSNNVVNFKAQRQHRVEIIPKNTAQEEYFSYLMNDDCRVIFATGPAGTGKTILATLRAIQMFKEGQVSKIIITRPAVSVDNEQHGFLPGSLVDKLEPWTKPILDVFMEYYSQQEIAAMIENNQLEICPLGYMRGRTFKNAVIVADECQCCSDNQMKMLLTRIGHGTRVFLTGDLAQTEKGFKNVNGLKTFLQLLEANESSGRMKVVRFEKQHVERDPIVEEILQLYDTIEEE